MIDTQRDLHYRIFRLSGATRRTGNGLAGNCSDQLHAEVADARSRWFPYFAVQLA